MIRPLGGVSTWMGDQIRIPRVVLIVFFLFSLPFSKAILKTAKLPSLRNIVSSLYQLFVPRFAMAVFVCIHLHYRIHKQRTRRSNCPQFSRLLIFQNI